MTRFSMILLLLLAGCGALGTAQAPLDAYTLTPLPAAQGQGAGQLHLVVDLPTSSGALATDRILIKPSPLQAEYLPKGRWVDPAPVLVQGLLVASLQNSGAFRLVGREDAGLTPDVVLLVEVNDFQAESAAEGTTVTPVRVGLTLTVLDAAEGRLVATRRFDAVATAATTDTLALVLAFDAATRAVLTKAVAWTIATAP